MPPFPDNVVENVAAETQPLPPLPSLVPDMTALLNALRRRWLRALSLGLICATAAGVLTWLLMPKKFTARSLLDVAANPPKVIFSTNENRGDPFNSFQRKQLALAKSRPVVAVALRQPKVAELSMVREQLEPVEWLESQLQTDYSVAPDILRIALSGNRPQEQVIIVDAVTEAYLQEVVHKENKRRLKRLDQLKELYDGYDDGLRRKRQTLRNLAESAGSGDSKTLALKHRLAIEQLARAEKELLELQSQIRKLQVEVMDQKNKEKTLGQAAIADGVIDDRVESDGLVQKYVKQVAQLEQHIQGLQGVAIRGAKDPTVERHREELKALQSSLAERRKELRPNIADELRHKARSQASSNLVVLEERGGLLNHHQKVLTEVINRLNEETQSMNKSGLSLGSLQDEITRADNLVKTVATEIDALNVELQAPPRVTLHETAGLSLSDSKRRQLLGIGGAALGAFALVLLAVSWWEFRNRRVTSAAEVVDGLGVIILGSVPNVPVRAQQRLLTAKAPQDVFWHNVLTESVNSIRTMLLHAARVEPLKVVMVTSSLGGEGKSSLSSQLAVSLARAGRRTLLVDGDMRRPSLHRLFDLPQSPGLAERLGADLDIADAIRSTAASDLWLLPAGQCTPHALQALAQDGIKPIFDKLREDFDFIVVDSCPVLPVVDSLLFAQHVDGVIFTLLRDVSRLPQVYAGYQKLAALKIRMLGIVVNGANPDSYGAMYSEYQYLTPTEK